MRILISGTARYDDLLEAQIGDVSHESGKATIAIFGSKTAQGDSQVVLADTGDPGSGLTSLIDSTRAGLTRLLKSPPADLQAMTAKMVALNTDPGHTGAEALSSWPADVRSMADHLYQLGMPAHRLPLFGRWLYDDLSGDTNLAAVESTIRFGQMVKRVMAGVADVPSHVAGHSCRRGGAITMLHNDVAPEVISLALRHASTYSTLAYFGDAARTDLIANSQRARARGGGRYSAGGPDGGSDNPTVRRPEPGGHRVGFTGLPVRGGQRPNPTIRPIGTGVLGYGIGAAYS